MDRAEFERLDRETLVARAQAMGVRRARVLTRPELIDELLRLDPAQEPAQLRRSRGFFGLARDLLSKVVERGLHLPDAADRLRVALGEGLPEIPRPEPQAVPTVTLAEIYAAQGHKARAVDTLRRVLEAEPDHGAARSLLARLQAEDYVEPPPPLPPEPDGLYAEIGSQLGSLDDAVTTTSDAELISETIGDLASASPAQTECVAIPLGSDRIYVFWRLSSETERVLQDRRLIVRAVVVLPTWDGPTRETRDSAFEPGLGECVLTDVPARAVVRVAIGWEDGSGFVPIAHSPSLSVSATRALVEWTPEGERVVALGEPRAASIARAAAAAERASHRIG